VRAESEADTLAVLPVAGLHIGRPLYLVRRKGRRDGSALQMGKLLGKKPQASRHRKCRRMPWSI
jgi:hypothetical protein